MVEKVAEKTDKARIITKARVTQLLCDSGRCVGCVYEKGGVEFQEHGPVILASGGFGADFSSNSLLAKYRPDLIHLPTTNGEHCTGDGIKMGEAIGGKTIDLEWVQVHPTGLVKPDDPDAKIKFLAAEALRGVGGLVLDAHGKRFANELGRRDYVTGEMWKNKPPFRLCLNRAASDEIIWHCKHYTGRGVMKFYESGEALAKDMGIPVGTLEETHDEHYQAARKTEKDPDGGPYPAYPSGKSWDAASGKTGSGKKFYHNIIEGSAVKTEPFYVAIITPVIHYCMGGLEIDVDSAVVSKSGKPITGLYAAGEVAGGVHGNNRLGGNSLLDCVVFGRVAGKHCARYMLGSDMKETSLKELSGGRDGLVIEDPESKAPSRTGPPKDPTKASYYNEEKWKGHLRSKTMGIWLSQQEKKRSAEATAAKEAEQAARDLEVGPLPEWEKRERQCLDSHYFPLPSEQGQDHVLPWFRETRASAHVQVFRWLQETWAARSDTGKRKCAMISSGLTALVVVVKVIAE